MRTAVVLPPTAPSFETVAGLPLIVRTVLVAQRSGFDRIVAMGGEHTDRLREVLGRDRRTANIEIAEIVPPLRDAEATVLASDHLLTRATLEHVRGTVMDGRPILFGTGTTDALARCPPAGAAGFDFSALGRGGLAQWGQALRAAGATVVALEHGLCMPISDAGSIDAAEERLCAQLREDSAESDGPLAYWVDRRISIRISRWLVRHTRLSPNQITLIGTTVGLSAAMLLALGGYWAELAGTLIFLLTTIIDGCDGEVARLTIRDSTFGQKLDVATDNLVHVAIFAGLAVGLYRTHPDAPYLFLCTVLLSGFAVTGAVTYFFLVHRPDFADSSAAPVSLRGRVRAQILRGLKGLMNRDFAYLLVLLALFNQVHWFLWGAAFGTFGFSALLIWVYVWRDAG